MKTSYLGIGWVFLLSGCLSNNYEVSHAELVRLAQTPPAARGEHVRVLQQTRGGADDVSDAPVGPHYEQTVVIVDVHNGGYGHEGGHYHGGGERSHEGGRERAGHEHGSSSGGTDHDGASSAVAAGVAAVAMAGAVGVSAAAIEGSRFDGWAKVPADEPLLLVRPDGTRWLPLSELTERDASWSAHAVMPNLGDELVRLDRAPLERQGFSYELELGAARLNTVSGVRDFGFGSRMAFGYFPTQTVGVLLGGQLAFGHSRDAASDGSVFNGRLFAELEYLPIHTERFHAGFYAELGGAQGIQDLPFRTHSWSGLYGAAGFLAQLDWTTRLALNLRAGVAALPGYPGSDDLARAYVPELTLGVAVY